MFFCVIGGHELSKTTGNAGARVGCGNYLHLSLLNNTKDSKNGSRAFMSFT